MAIGRDDNPVWIAPVPPPPREPSKRARKLVFRYTGAQLVMLIVGLGFVGMGLPMAVGFNWSVPAEIAIDTSRASTPGTVTRAWLDTSVEVNGEHPTRFEFKYALDGMELAADSSSTDARYASLKPGDTVEVEYARSHPAWARVKGTDYSVFGYIATFVILFPLIGALITFFAIRSNRREIRAYRHGVAGLAHVTFSGLDHSTRINNRHPYKIAWELEVHGAKYQGSISSMDESALAEWAKMADVTVLYDPENPVANTLWVP